MTKYFFGCRETTSEIWLEKSAEKLNQMHQKVAGLESIIETGWQKALAKMEKA